MSEKQNRQRTFRTIVSRQVVTSQEQLAELLAAEGIRSTQTTLSRDINELGIWKGPDGYVLNSNLRGRAGKNELKRVLQGVLESMEVASNLLVLKTKPGRAQPIGYELDNTDLPLVVGNIAGDDTIFIATRSSDDAIRLKEELTSLI